MSTGMRRFHQFAIGIHFAGLCLFAYCYAILPSAVFVVFAGWSVWFAACSCVALRKGKAGVAA